MDISFEFEGWKELMESVEDIATSNDLDDINKEIVKEASIIAHRKAKEKMPTSNDNSKSGRASSRPNGHAKDKIPISSVKKSKNGGFYIIVGWGKSDTSPHFYNKFLEWGTSKMPPLAIFGQVNREIQSEIEKIAINKYNKFLDEKLEGR